MNTDSFRHKADPAISAAFFAMLPHEMLMAWAEVFTRGTGVFSDKAAASLQAEIARRKGADRPIRQVLAGQRN